MWVLESELRLSCLCKRKIPALSTSFSGQQSVLTNNWLSTSSFNLMFGVFYFVIPNFPPVELQKTPLEFLVPVLPLVAKLTASGSMDYSRIP